MSWSPCLSDRLHPVPSVLLAILFLSFRWRRSSHSGSPLSLLYLYYSVSASYPLPVADSLSLCISRVEHSYFLDFGQPRLGYKKWQTISLQETYRCDTNCFKSSIHFYLTLAFFTKREEWMIPMQVCLGTDTYTHMHIRTHGQIPTIDVYITTHTHVHRHTYMPPPPT